MLNNKELGNAEVHFQIAVLLNPLDSSSRMLQYYSSGLIKINEAMRVPRNLTTLLEEAKKDLLDGLEIAKSIKSPAADNFYFWLGKLSYRLRNLKEAEIYFLSIQDKSKFSRFRVF